MGYLEALGNGSIYKLAYFLSKSLLLGAKGDWHPLSRTMQGMYQRVPLAGFKSGSIPSKSPINGGTNAASF